MSDASNADSLQKSEPRVGGVIVSHGQLARELLAAAEMIIGPITHITSVSIGWHDDVGVASEEISRAISHVNEGNGVLLLTDMFGGTPTNIASMFLVEGKVEVVTGVNLPMVIRLATQTEPESLSEIAKRVLAQGQEAIYAAGDLLTPKKKS
jgi:PTS system mannose-specific IIA component